MFIFFQRSELLGGIVDLNGLGLDHDRGVGFLPVLGFGGDGPCHVATHHHDACQNDSHNQNLSHLYVVF